MTILRLAAITMAVALSVSCSFPPPFCGESFCLSEKPTSVSKETPVEDFNLYRVTFGERQFLIYEGNHPDTLRMKDFGPVGPDMVPQGFVEGQLYGDEQSFTEVLRTTNRRWPTHVAVSVKSKNPNDLAILVSKLRGKQSKVG